MNINSGMKISLLSSIFTASLLVGACSSENGDAGFTPVAGTSSGDISSRNIEAQATSGSAADSFGTTTTISQNTQMLDKQGNMLDASDVVLTIQAYDGSEASEREFTGGFVITDADVSQKIADALVATVDATDAVKLDLVGWAKINVLAGGIAAKQFSPPLQITILTPGVANGTKIAVISVDEDTEEREFLGTSTVQNGAINFTTDHLSALAGVGGATNLSGGGK